MQNTVITHEPTFYSHTDQTTGLDGDPTYQAKQRGPESGGNAEYVLDATGTGQKKGMILLGHMLSEDFGMKEVADWLRTFLADVPIEWIPAGEPFSSFR